MDVKNRWRYDFARKKLRRYADEVIKVLKGLGRKDGMQSSIDSGLNSIWDEWLVQVHGEHSIFYEQYKDVIHGFVDAFIEKLPEDDIGSMWLDSEAAAEYFDGLDDEAVDDKPSLSNMKEGAMAELYSAVMDIAENCKLPENVENYLLEDRE